MLQECLLGNSPTLKNCKGKVVERQISVMKKMNIYGLWQMAKQQLKKEHQQEVTKKFLWYKSHNNK